MAKLEKKNEDGILIIKEVAEEMVSDYLNAGWTISKPKIEEVKVENTFSSKFKGNKKNKK